MNEALVSALLGSMRSSGNEAVPSMGWPMATIGGDLDSMVLGNALAATNPSSAAALAQAIEQRKLQNATLVAERAVGESNLQPLGFVALNVAAGAQAQVTTQPQTLFKPMRFTVPTTIASFFVLDDVKVGNVSQFPSSNPIPCEAFVPGMFGGGLSLRTVNPAINLQVTVTNIDNAAHDFRAAFFGISVQG
jgi:hypothetical protein